MLKVYVAGAMSSSDPIKFMDNLRKGMRLSTEVLLAGHAPFPVFCDYSLFFQLRDGEEIPVETIKASSMAWLEASDCVLLVSGWENSKGTQAELARAQELGIPRLYSLSELDRYQKSLKEDTHCGGLFSCAGCPAWYKKATCAYGSENGHNKP